MGADGFLPHPRRRRLPDSRYTLQVYAEDCTGCSLCVEACPAVGAGSAGTQGNDLEQREPLIEAAGENVASSRRCRDDRSRVDFGTVRGTQPGAAVRCSRRVRRLWQTPYREALSQLFGDRLMVANATGCSSIYGGNLPTTPWTTDADGRGPAWSNSLFEDNASSARVQARCRSPHGDRAPPGSRSCASRSAGADRRAPVCAAGAGEWSFTRSASGSRS